jgi:hypothetical protein
MSDQFILDDGNQFILFDSNAANAQTSFSAPNLNTYIRVVISMLRIEDGAVTNITFCNREVLSSLDYWPLLRRVDNSGAKMGEFLPEQTRSSIVIDNSINSFGTERKFSDLLDRYTLIERPAYISIAQVPLNKDTIADGDFTEIWRSIITDVSFSDDSLKISMSRAVIPVKIVTKVVDKNSFPSAPQESLGKHLPIIFSDSNEFIEIDPVATTGIYTSGAGASALDVVDYAYATTFSNRFLPSGTSTDAVKVYAEGLNREWQEVTFVSDPLAPVYEHPIIATSIKNSWGTIKEYGYQLKAGQNVTGGEIITGVNWFLCTTTYTITPPFIDAYSYTVKVWDCKNGFPSTVLATDTLERGDVGFTYDRDVNGGTLESVWKLEFRLSRPIQVPVESNAENNALFVTLSRNDPSNLFSLVQDPGTVSAYEKYVLRDQNFVRTVETNAKDPFQVFAIGKTDDLSGGSSATYQNGLGHVGFSIRMKAQVFLPDISKIRLIAKSRGLRDDTSGTITGTPSNRLVTPKDQIRLLMMDWNGSAWVENYFNSTKFSETHSAAFGSSSRWDIRTAGATQGRTRARDLMEEICKNGMCRLVPYVSGGNNVVGLYAHGTRLASSFLIDDENAKLISYEIGGVETIINKVQMLFNRSIQNRLESLLAEGGLSNFLSIINSESTSLDVPYLDITTSIFRWGERPLDSVAFPFITKEKTAKSVAAYILRRFNQPYLTVRIEVPYNRYATLENMQVGTLKMTGLPDYYGTTLDAKKTTAGTNTDGTDLNFGHYWKRYKSYRVQLEGNDVVFSNSEALKRVLTFKILKDIDIA